MGRTIKSPRSVESPHVLKRVHLDLDYLGKPLSTYKLPSTHGAYCIAAPAADLYDALRNKPKYTKFVQSIEDLGPAVWIVKNGESEMLKVRGEQHEMAHFKDVVSARVLVACTTEAGLGGFAQYAFNRFAHKCPVADKLPGVDWFAVHERNLENYKTSLANLCDDMRDVNSAAQTMLVNVETRAGLLMKGPVPKRTQSPEARPAVKSPSRRAHTLSKSPKVSKKLKLY